jgi:hypothetical protein
MMKKVVLSLLIGIAAGIIDVILMLIQKIDFYYSLSAFVHWIIVGFVITHIEFGFKSWSKGLIIAELLALPIIIIEIKMDTFGIFPIITMSAILGSLVGFISDKYAK